MIDKTFILNNRSTPLETPALNKAFLWYENGSLKYKNDGNQIFTLATGISAEEVQDIIGSSISAGSNKVSVSYNDPANLIVIDVVTANLIHQQLSGAGTNTHAQIDSHIASTSNPHNVTAAQVGALTSGQTATAISSAIDSHTSQPDPHSQYAFDSDLNNKADKTTAINTSGGLQGGGDLSASRNLSLTDTGVNAATYGGTNIPTFTVDQKGRITFAANGPSLVLGDQFEQGVDDTAFTTTSGVNQIAASFSTNNKPSGFYRIGMQWAWSINSTASDAIFGIYLDGSLIGPEFRKEPQEGVNQLFPWSWFLYENLSSGVHTLELRVRNEAAGPTISVNTVSYELWRVN